MALWNPAWDKKQWWVGCVVCCFGLPCSPGCCDVIRAGVGVNAMKIALVPITLIVIALCAAAGDDAWARGLTCQKHCGMLTSASVHTAPAQLPTTMLGGWCPTTDKPNMYTRSKTA